MLSWGTSSDKLTNSAATTEDNVKTHRHLTRLCQLTYGQTYYYSVACGKTGATGHFLTPPVPISPVAQVGAVAPLKFLAIGDTRSHPDVFNAVVYLQWFTHIH